MTVKELWDTLSDIPVTATGRIKENWLHFKAGTKREDIWTWFESTFHVIAHHLMYGEPEESRSLTIENIEAILNDDFGISADIRNSDVSIEFWTDTAGQDICIEFDFDGTGKDFVRKFTDWAESYDVDEEAALYAESLGKNGVPSSMKVLLDDITEAKETVMSIAKAIGKLKEEGDENGN